MTITELTTVDAVRPTDWIALAREIGEQLQPAAADSDRTGEISSAAFTLLRERGVTSALIPAEFGGGGATHAELGAFLRELGRHDAPTALTLSMHSHVVATQVWRHRHGPDASGVFAKVVDCSALLISTGASDWVGPSGSAQQVDGGFRVIARTSPTCCTSSVR